MLKRKAQLFPASRLLKFVAIDVLEPLQHTMKGYQYITMISIQHRKLTKVIPVGSDSNSSGKCVLRVEDRIK